MARLFEQNECFCAEAVIDKEALLERLERLLVDLNSGKPASDVLLKFTRVFPFLQELDLTEFDFDNIRDLERDPRDRNRRLELILRRFIELLQERIDQERD